MPLTVRRVLDKVMESETRLSMAAQCDDDAKQQMRIDIASFHFKCDIRKGSNILKYRHSKLSILIDLLNALAYFFVQALKAFAFLYTSTCH
jgi:hypothetical protein